MKQVINEVLTDEQLARAVSDYVLSKHRILFAGVIQVTLRPLPMLGGTLHNVVVSFDGPEPHPRFKWHPN